jgi:hypothetical protein
MTFEFYREQKPSNLFEQRLLEFMEERNFYFVRAQEDGILNYYFLNDPTKPYTKKDFKEYKDTLYKRAAELEKLYEEVYSQTSKIIPIPLTTLKELGWNEWTTLSMSVEGNSIKVVQKTEWSVEEAQENIETIMKDVEYNGTTHYIIDKSGKKFALIPYGEYEKSIDKEK